MSIHPPVSVPMLPSADEAQRLRLGLWLGVAGMLMFAVTIPMTRLAGGPAEDPQLPPEFVAIGRAAVAGFCALAYLCVTRARRPRRGDLPLLALSGLCVIFGWPVFLGLAVRHVDAVHAAVVTGVLPLATAAVGALWLRQRPSAGFWACALLGCALVVGYAWTRGGGRPDPADALLLGAVMSAAVGYVGGARLAARGLRAEEVIGWILVLYLPVTLPAAAWIGWHEADALAAARPAAWGGFAYVSVVSMWLGFFAWYRGLALGGTLRVSQVQLLQPFAAMAMSVPLLGERLDAATLAFSLGVIATVLVGKRMPAGTPAAGGAR